MKQLILKEFDNQKVKLNIFRKKMETLLNDLLQEKSIHFHLVSSRLKERLNLAKKIDSKNDKYLKLDDVTDIVGLRIITFLDSEVEEVAKLIEDEFTIDLINTIDKRKLKNDQFGYKSLHYIVSLKGDRCNLVEYSNYNSLKFEIQIRTILQHSWAEIEHDLGYKGELSIPDIYKRGFNRLAALLETADVEFDRLKKDILTYEQNIKKLIKEIPEDIELNQNSLLNFIQINEMLQKTNEKISKITNSDIYITDNVEGILERFKFFNINTIKEFEIILIDYYKDFNIFLDHFLSSLNERKLPNTISVFYFQHFLATKKCTLDYILQYAKAGIVEIDIDENTAASWINIYKKIKNGR